MKHVNYTTPPGCGACRDYLIRAPGKKWHIQMLKSESLIVKAVHMQFYFTFKFHKFVHISHCTAAYSCSALCSFSRSNMQASVHDSKYCLHQQRATSNGSFGKAFSSGCNYSVLPGDVDMVTASQICTVLVLCMDACVSLYNSRRDFI